MKEIVECPYCSEDVDISDYYNEDGEGFDFECPNCESIFEVTVEYNPSYSASKIIYKECKDCGNEFRYTGKSYPKPEKYKDLKDNDYIICKDCFRREYRKDFLK